VWIVDQRSFAARFAPKHPERKGLLYGAKLRLLAVVSTG